MGLENEILTDLIQLLAEHGVNCRWQTTSFLALATTIKVEQQMELGGFVEMPDLNLKFPKNVFTGAIPEFGQRIVVDGKQYRIIKVSGHPRSPLMTLTLSTTDE